MTSWVLLGVVSAVHSPVFRGQLEEHATHAIEVSANGGLAEDTADIWDWLKTKSTKDHQDKVEAILAVARKLLTHSRPSSLIQEVDNPGKNHEEYLRGKQLFDAIDTNRDGSVSRDEFKAYLKSRGYPEAGSDKEFLQADQNHDNHIDVSEVVSMVSGPKPSGSSTTLPAKEHTKQQMAEKMFKDMHPSGKGGVTYNEFEAHTIKHHPNLANDEHAISRSFARADSNGDGTLSECEIAHMFGAGSCDHEDKTRIEKMEVTVKKAQSLFTQLDTDGNGSVTAAEFAACERIKSNGWTPEKIQTEFSNADTDKDNALEIAEVVQMLGGAKAGSAESKAAILFSEMDTNEDASVSNAEYIAHGGGDDLILKFKDADYDENGKLQFYEVDRAVELTEKANKKTDHWANDPLSGESGEQGSAGNKGPHVGAFQRSQIDRLNAETEELREHTNETNDATNHTNGETDLLRDQIVYAREHAGDATQYIKEANSRIMAYKHLVDHQKAQKLKDDAQKIAEKKAEPLKEGARVGDHMDMAKDAGYHNAAHATMPTSNADALKRHKVISDRWSLNDIKPEGSDEPSGEINGVDMSEPGAKLFAAMDVDGSHAVAQAEFQNFLISLGLTESGAQKKWARANPDADIEITDPTKLAHVFGHEPKKKDGNNAGILDTLDMLPPGETHIAPDAAVSMDVDTDGKLSLNEWERFAGKMGLPKDVADRDFKAVVDQLHPDNQKLAEEEVEFLLVDRSDKYDVTNATVDEERYAVAQKRYEDHESQLAAAALAALPADEISRAFKMMDTDGNDLVDRSEYTNFMSGIGVEYGDASKDFTVADKNRDQKLNLTESEHLLSQDNVQMMPAMVLPPLYTGIKVKPYPPIATGVDLPDDIEHKTPEPTEPEKPFPDVGYGKEDDEADSPGKYEQWLRDTHGGKDDATKLTTTTATTTATPTRLASMANNCMDECLKYYVLHSKAFKTNMKACQRGCNYNHVEHLSEQSSNTTQHAASLVEAAPTTYDEALSVNREAHEIDQHASQLEVAAQRALAMAAAELKQAQNAARSAEVDLERARLDEEEARLAAHGGLSGQTLLKKNVHENYGSKSQSFDAMTQAKKAMTPIAERTRGIPFVAMDIDADGKISESEFRHLVGQLGVGPATATRNFNAADENIDGFLNEKESGHALHLLAVLDPEENTKPLVEEVVQGGANDTKAEGPWSCPHDQVAPCTDEEATCQGQCRTKYTFSNETQALLSASYLDSCFKGCRFYIYRQHDMNTTVFGVAPQEYNPMEILGSNETDGGNQRAGPDPDHVARIAARAAEGGSGGDGRIGHTGSRPS